MNYSVILNNLKQFSGSGTYFTLLLICLLYFLFSLKDERRAALLYFPASVLFVYFCPAWCIYIKLRDDGGILYRILWLIPFGVIICFVLIELIYKLPKKARGFSFAVAVLIIMTGGSYVYSNPIVSKAENPYHMPKQVVEICDEIIVEGREVACCFPPEFIQYVRQYTPYVRQPLGRDFQLYGLEIISQYKDIWCLYNDEAVDVDTAAPLLKNLGIQYLVLSQDKGIKGSLADYHFYYAFSVDGYDVYLDNDAYLGIDYVNFS